MENLATSKEFKSVRINQFSNEQPIGFHVTSSNNWMLTYYTKDNEAVYYPYKSTEKQMKNQLTKIFIAEGLIK